MRKARRVGVAALSLAIMLGSCNRENRYPNRRDPYGLSDSSRDPGNPLATNDQSMKLLDDDPELRRLTFHTLLVSDKKPCSYVTEAVLKGGAGGTDVWRATCADSGDWLVTFWAEESHSVESCKESQRRCREAWAPMFR